MKYTPGPWKFYDNRGDDLFDYSPGADGSFRIVTSNFEDKDLAKVRIEADARLIAVAPELLQSLKDIRQWLLTFKCKPIDQAAAEFHLDHLNKAIAKAEGKNDESNI